MTISFEDFKKSHSNYSEVGAHNEQTWRGIIDMLNAEGWTPDEYMDFVFKEYRKPMVPSLLSNHNVIEKYRVAREERVALSNRRAEWATEQVKVRLRNNVKVDDILKDIELKGHALFMYLIAAQSKKEEAMDRFRKAAIYELKTSPELYKIYGIKFNKRLFPND